MAESLEQKSVTSQALGKLLDLTPQRINQLAAEGWIRKSGRNAITLKDGIKGYLAFLEDRQQKATASTTDDELRAERARKLRLENDHREGQLIEMEEAMLSIDIGFGAVRVGLAAVPARVTRDLALRQKIDDEINRVLAAAAAELEKRAAVLQAGEDPEAGAEDDDG